MKEIFSKLFCGMDLHSNNVFIGILDEFGKRLFSKRVPNNLEGILRYLLPFKGDIQGVVVESTFNWYWLIDGLEEAGYKVHLAHPPAIIQYSGIKNQDDKHSAFFLAQLLKDNNLLSDKRLPQGYIFPKKERHLRDLLRKRSVLVNNRTRYILSFKSLVNRTLSINMSSNVIKTLNDDDLEKMFSNEHLRMTAKSSISAMHSFTVLIKEIENEILKVAELKPEFQILKTAPGIGNILALNISLETGTISRFKEVGNYASYCRCVPAKKSSNNKVKGSTNRKNGNKYLAWSYLEAAHKLKRYCPNAMSFYKRKSIQVNKIVAIKALAHKLSRACYFMMKDNVPFDVERIFGKPIKPINKGSGSKPLRGLDLKPKAPIGPAAALPLRT
jgi:transposase